MARPTHDMPQLFWYDDHRPVAAVIATDWGDGVAPRPAVPARRVPGSGRARAGARDSTMRQPTDSTQSPSRSTRTTPVCAMCSSGGACRSIVTALVETWIAADARPAVSPLHEDYRLSTRADTADRPHHMIDRSRADVEPRLQQASLYRADLDLVVHDIAGEVAGYGLFWLDPATATGLVEPMRTIDTHQRRGIARHILTSGLDRLAAAGAGRIKICYEVDNPPARDLYLGVGFEPVRQTVMFSGPTAP